MFKPFFIHKHHGAKKLSNRHPRGFTLYIEQDPVNARNVVCSGAFCSPKDQFVKKDGRSHAAQASTKTINKRDLPKLLNAMSLVSGFNENVERDWFYVLKYVV